MLSRLLIRGFQPKRLSLKLTSKVTFLTMCKSSVKLLPSAVIFACPIIISRATCEESRGSRVNHNVDIDKTISKVPWVDILSLLKPEIWLFITAVVSAVIVAIINIKIPLLLGSLVNGIAKLTGLNDIVALKPTALKLIFLYGLQV